MAGFWNGDGTVVQHRTGTYDAKYFLISIAVFALLIRLWYEVSIEGPGRIAGCLILENLTICILEIGPASFVGKELQFPFFFLGVTLVF